MALEAGRLQLEQQHRITHAMMQCDHLEADLQQLGSLGRGLLEGVLQHDLEGRALAVGVVAQEAENGVQIVHTVLNGGATQAPAPACLQPTTALRAYSCDGDCSTGCM